VVRLPPRPSLPRFARYTLAVPRLRDVLRDFRPQVVNAHFLPNYGWMAARAGAQPLVLTALGSDILTVPRRSALHAWRTRWVLARCAAVTSDAAMLSAALGAFGVDAARILTVPFGIEAGRFGGGGGGERGDRPIVVLSTRRLEPIYDLGTLLAAWEQLGVAERGGLELRIAGTGSQEAALRRRGAGLGARFLGWLATPQLDAALRAAHVYVSTSRSDSTSVSLLEAMAAGCLPVVSDIPANREWIEAGDNGLLFPAGDAAALAEALRRAGGDADLRRRAAVRNRDLVAARATWEHNIDEVEALFARLAAAPRSQTLPRG
jgi:glycosyltransferase involved in cell wall biosynthesis